MRRGLGTVLVGLAVACLCGCDKAGRQLPIPPGQHGECNTSLLDAVHQHDRAGVAALRKRGASTHCSELIHELSASIAADDVDAVAWLLEVGADPNWNGPCTLNPLEAAFAGRHQALRTRRPALRETRILALLLEAGADPDGRWEGCGGLPWPGWRPGRGVTPLMIAALAGDVEFAELLLGAGADAAARDATGRTALDYARASAEPESARVAAMLSR
jgi:Ankyrin repeats (many copies)